MGEIFENEIWTLSQVLNQLGIGRSTFYRGVKSGSLDIPYRKIGKKMVFSKRQVIDWIEKGDTPKSKRRYTRWR